MSETGAFDELAQEFFSVWFRFHPDAALEAGQQDFGQLLPAQSDDDHAALGSWLETLIVALEEINFQALDERRRLDLELMFSLARVEHRELLERDWRHRDPLRFLPLAEIHRLTLLRPPGLRDALSTLLTATPDHLRSAIAQLQPMAELVPPALVRSAIVAADDGRCYLRALVRSRWLRTHCHGHVELETQAEAAGEALAQYAGALRRDIAPRAAGNPGCGEAHLRFRLRHRHLLGVEPSACVPLLDKLAGQCDLALAAAAPDTAPDRPPDNGQSALVDILRTDCRDAAARIQQRELLTLPTAPLRIAVGPPAPQAYGDPIDYVPDLMNGEGILYVPDDTDNSGAAINRAVIRLLCVRLGWGGAHAMAFSGGMAARALPRRLAGGSSLTSGWSLYIERLLFDSTEAEPNERLAALQRRRNAITLARLDLELHCGTINLDQAMLRLQRMEPNPERAQDQLAQITRTPGDAFAAVLGWRLIEAAAAEFDTASTRALHDQLIGLGAIPLPLVLRRTLGDAAWDRILGAEITEPLSARPKERPDA
jgi:uncharacterized protein (DUF885 family)